jgi:hypothetical protein
MNKYKRNLKIALIKNSDKKEKTYYFGYYIKKRKKHGALVNGAKLGGTAPLTRASCYFV